MNNKQKSKFKIPFIIVLIIAIIFILLYINEIAYTKKEKPKGNIYLCENKTTIEKTKVHSLERIYYNDDGTVTKIDSGTISDFKNKKDIENAKKEIKKVEGFKYEDYSKNSIYVYSTNKPPKTDGSSSWYITTIRNMLAQGYKCSKGD